MKTRVGIEAIAVAVPHRFVDMEDLARARGVDPAKYTQGLGALEMAVADPGEDTVALAAEAARRLIDTAAVKVDSLGMLVVGTETGVDHSKPVASFVHGLLELPRQMRVYDTQHACYGGTAGLMAACEWIASGAAAGRKAIVICSDIARYGLKTAGEPTQGAGAVAMLISDDPQVLALDFGISGTSSTHVHDFWRPLGQREAEVDGHYSVQCYLNALSEAYRGWKARAMKHGLLRDGEALPSEQVAHFAYHVPFCKMAKKAHAQVRKTDLEDAQRPVDAAEEGRAAQSFKQQVDSSLALCAKVGNIYTGSLYLSLAGLLVANGAQLANQRVGLFSYGSGCSSEFFSGVVGPHAAAKIAAAGIPALLAARERVSVEEYERILALPSGSPRSASAPGTFRFTGVVDRRRQYA